MQTYRTAVTWSWENHFSTTGHSPAGYTPAPWDSLAWNWKVCIENGRWIFEEAMPAKMVPQQRAFPDSCSYINCDSVPDIANQEDLANYGYHAGETKMRRITTQLLWNNYINNPSKSEADRANYIKWVRRYKYRGNLW
jgi:hypothetical protein